MIDVDHADVAKQRGDNFTRLGSHRDDRQEEVGPRLAQPKRFPPHGWSDSSFRAASILFLNDSPIRAIIEFDIRPAVLYR